MTAGVSHTLTGLRTGEPALAAPGGLWHPWSGRGWDPSECPCTEKEGSQVPARVGLGQKTTPHSRLSLWLEPQLYWRSTRGPVTTYTTRAPCSRLHSTTATTAQSHTGPAWRGWGAPARPASFLPPRASDQSWGGLQAGGQSTPPRPSPQSKGRRDPSARPNPQSQAGTSKIRLNRYQFPNDGSPTSRAQQGTPSPPQQPSPPYTQGQQGGLWVSCPRCPPPSLLPALGHTRAKDMRNPNLFTKY